MQFSYCGCCLNVVLNLPHSWTALLTFCMMRREMQLNFLFEIKTKHGPAEYQIRPER